MSHLSLTAADVPSHHYLQDPSRNFLPHVIILLVLAAIQFWAVANTGENAVNKAKRWKDRTSDCLAYWHLSGPDTGRSNGTKETVMTPQNGFNNIGGLFCLGWVGTNLVWSGERRGLTGIFVVRKTAA